MFDRPDRSSKFSNDDVREPLFKWTVTFYYHMVKADMIFALFPLASLIICTFLGAYVLWKNRFLSSSRAFIALSFFTACMSTSELFMIISPDWQSAMVFARGTYFFSICAAGSLLYLSNFLPYERNGSWAITHRRAYAGFILTIAALPAIFLSSVTLDSTGWWATEDLLFFLWLMIVFLCCLATIIVLGKEMLRAKGTDAYRLSAFLVLGASFPFLYGFAEILSDLFGFVLPPMMSAAVLGTSLIFGIAVFSQRLFIVEPVSEVPPTEPVETDSSTCRLLMVEGNDPDKAYRMFVDEVTCGAQGLLISVIAPGLIRERFSLAKTPMIWISTQPGPDRVDPSSLSILQHTILDFLEKGSGPVVLLDGIEHLVVYNSSEKVEQMIYRMVDIATITGSKIIVPIDPRSLLSKDLARLEREFDLVQSDATDD